MGNPTSQTIPTATTGRYIAAAAALASRLPSHPTLSRRHHATHRPTSPPSAHLRVLPITFLSLFCHHIRRRLTATQSDTARAPDLLAHASPSKPRAARTRTARVYTNFCAVIRPFAPQVNCRSKRHRMRPESPRPRLSRKASSTSLASRPSPGTTDYHQAIHFLRTFGRPHLFITFKCNLDWEEIQTNLLPGQPATDRPDIVCTVFKMKLDQLLRDLDDGVFGAAAAYSYSIEYQKRGSPHAHLLLRLRTG